MQFSFNHAAGGRRIRKNAVRLMTCMPRKTQIYDSSNWCRLKSELSINDDHVEVGMRLHHCGTRRPSACGEIVCLRGIVDSQSRCQCVAQICTAPSCIGCTEERAVSIQSIRHNMVTLGAWRKLIAPGASTLS